MDSIPRTVEKQAENARRQATITLSPNGSTSHRKIGFLSEKGQALQITVSIPLTSRRFSLANNAIEKKP